MTTMTSHTSRGNELGVTERVIFSCLSATGPKVTAGHHVVSQWSCDTSSVTRHLADHRIGVIQTWGFRDYLFFVLSRWVSEAHHQDCHTKQHDVFCQTSGQPSYASTRLNTPTVSWIFTGHDRRLLLLGITLLFSLCIMGRVLQCQDVDKYLNWKLVI